MVISPASAWFSRFSMIPASGSLLRYFRKIQESQYSLRCLFVISYSPDGLFCGFVAGFPGEDATGFFVRTWFWLGLDFDGLDFGDFKGASGGYFAKDAAGDGDVFSPDIS